MKGKRGQATFSLSDGGTGRKSSLSPFAVSAVVVGSEVLTGKVADLNGPLLIRRLRERGVTLHSVTTVHDDVDAIVEAVSLQRKHARYILTSGGIGPTHDDVTVRAVALALGRRVVRLPQMEALIRAHYLDATTPEALRLADVPEGSVLCAQPSTWYPIIRCEDIYLLPGVPELFARQLETVLPNLPGHAVHARALFLRCGEAAVAGALDAVALDMPDVAIGSYPQFGAEADHRVKITLEGPEATRVELALARLLRELPQDAVIRQG